MGGALAEVDADLTFWLAIEGLVKSASGLNLTASNADTYTFFYLQLAIINIMSLHLHFQSRFLCESFVFFFFFCVSNNCHKKSRWSLGYVGLFVVKNGSRPFKVNAAYLKASFSCYYRFFY